MQHTPQTNERQRKALHTEKRKHISFSTGEILACTITKQCTECQKVSQSCCCCGCLLNACRSSLFLIKRPAGAATAERRIRSECRPESLIEKMALPSVHRRRPHLQDRRKTSEAATVMETNIMQEKEKTGGGSRREKTESGERQGQTNAQADQQRAKQTMKQANKKTNKQTEKQRCRKTKKPTKKATNRQGDKQTKRQAGNAEDEPRDKHTERQTNKGKQKE